jgi:hypothetical protein
MKESKPKQFIIVDTSIVYRDGKEIKDVVGKTKECVKMMYIFFETR